MPTRKLAVLGLVAALLAAVAIPALDLPLARAIRASTLEDAVVLQRGTVLLDQLTGKGFGKFTLALALGLAGLVFFLVRRRLALLYVALVHALAYTLSGVGKPLFGRLRPDVTLATAPEATWFVGGDAFPSGHTAYYFGVGLPLVLVWPRLWPLWLSVPTFIAVARLDAVEHHLSDVCASIALSCLVALALHRPLRARL